MNNAVNNHQTENTTKFEGKDYFAFLLQGNLKYFLSTIAIALIPTIVSLLIDLGTQQFRLNNFIFVITISLILWIAIHFGKLAIKSIFIIQNSCARMKNYEETLIKLGKVIHNEKLERIITLWTRWGDDLQLEEELKQHPEHFPAKLGRDYVGLIPQKGFAKLDDTIDNLLEDSMFEIIDTYTRDAIEMTVTIPRPKWYLDEVIKVHKTGKSLSYIRKSKSINDFKRVKLLATTMKTAVENRDVRLWRIFILKKNNVMEIIRDALHSLRLRKKDNRKQVSPKIKDVKEIQWFKEIVSGVNNSSEGLTVRIHQPDSSNVPKYLLLWGINTDILNSKATNKWFENLRVDSTIEDFVLFNRNLVIKFYQFEEPKRGALSLIWDEVYDTQEEKIKVIQPYTSLFKRVQKDYSNLMEVNCQGLSHDFTELLVRIEDKIYVKKEKKGWCFEISDPNQPGDTIRFFPRENMTTKKDKTTYSKVITEILFKIDSRFESKKLPIKLSVSKLYRAILELMNEGNLYHEEEYRMMFSINPHKWLKDSLKR